MKNTVIIGGIYRHFKGNTYEVIALAKSADNLDDLVVYKNTEKGDVWVRGLKDFCEDVTRDGKTFERFKLMNQGE